VKAMFFFYLNFGTTISSDIEKDTTIAPNTLQNTKKQAENVAVVKKTGCALEFISKYNNQKTKWLKF
jgi:hypothetical protein